MIVFITGLVLVRELLRNCTCSVTLHASILVCCALAILTIHVFYITIYNVLLYTGF